MRRVFAALLASAVFVAFECGDFEKDGPEATPDPADTGSGDVLAPESDAHITPGPSDAAVAEASPPVAQACTPRVKFGPPKPIPNLHPAAVCFALSRDEKTAIFNENSKLYTAPWSDGKVGSPTMLTVQQATESVGCAVLNNDGTGIFNEELFHLFWQTRLGAAEYGEAKGVAANGPASGRLIGLPAIDHTTSELYVSVIGTDLKPPYTIARAQFHVDGTVDTFTNVDLNGDKTVGAPVISGDGLTLYFAGGDNDASANRQIWMATRANNRATFADPREIEELVVDQDTQAPNYISNDGCHLFFMRTNLQAGRTMWMATRTP